MTETQTDEKPWDLLEGFRAARRGKVARGGESRDWKQGYRISLQRLPAEAPAEDDETPSVAQQIRMLLLDQAKSEREIAKLVGCSVKYVQVVKWTDKHPGYKSQWAREARSKSHA